MTDCPCYRCTKARVDEDPQPGPFGVDPRMVRMFLCVACGNKRCPRAAWHMNPCTGSNEPGQKGSLYE